MTGKQRKSASKKAPAAHKGAISQATSAQNEAIAHLHEGRFAEAGADF
ncbi:MAG: hypothetical protein P8Y36_10695 [Alphaproteobacteria bacterium]